MINHQFYRSFKHDFILFIQFKLSFGSTLIHGFWCLTCRNLHSIYWLEFTLKFMIEILTEDHVWNIHDMEHTRSIRQHDKFWSNQIMDRSTIIPWCSTCRNQHVWLSFLFLERFQFHTPRQNKVHKVQKQLYRNIVADFTNLMDFGCSSFFSKIVCRFWGKV